MKPSYDLTSVISLKNYPHAKSLPKPHLRPSDLKRIVFVSNLTWALAFFGTLAFLYLLYLAFVQLRGQNHTANDRVTELETEVAHLTELHQTLASHTLVTAQKMQLVLDSAHDDQREFIASLLPEAMAMQASQGLPASAIIAMAIHESGYGHSELAQEHNNFFGLKAFPSTWDGPRVRQHTVDEGRRTMAYFRKFEDLQSGLHGYAEFLTSSWRYQKALQIRNGEKFVAAVLEAGYCPDQSYLENIKLIMHRHHLAELDLPEPVVPDIQISSRTTEDVLFGFDQPETIIK
jgi:flagellum-specific peptidoglycan hydrolase FlgJ